MTVGGIVQAVEAAIDGGLDAGASARPLAEGSPLAASHGTRLPDRPGADDPGQRHRPRSPRPWPTAGALPFLALALLRGPEVRALLDDAAERLGGPALGRRHPRVRRRPSCGASRSRRSGEARPPFALIAGGRPDQARELEREGIATYLHVPSPGPARPVPQGRGPAVRPRRARVRRPRRPAVELRPLGAGGRGPPRGDRPGHRRPRSSTSSSPGGIHDARSAAAVAALAAPLAERGVKVGVLIGTAYLFTERGRRPPARSSRGSRTRRSAAGGRSCWRPARATRSASARRRSPTRSRPSGAGCSPRGGRPRRSATRSSGSTPAGSASPPRGSTAPTGPGSPLVAVAEPDQYERGASTCSARPPRSATGSTTIAELHREICRGRRRPGSTAARRRGRAATPPPRPSDVAIVGMSAILPGRGRRRGRSGRTRSGGSTRSPRSRPTAGTGGSTTTPTRRPPTRSSRSGAGSSPTSRSTRSATGCRRRACRRSSRCSSCSWKPPGPRSTTPAIADRPFARERTAVVLGAWAAARRSSRWATPSARTCRCSTPSAPGPGARRCEACEGLLPEWTEDSFPGFLLNVAAGRVANRFDLGGANYTVDAACGSSLAAARAGGPRAGDRARPTW